MSTFEAAYRAIGGNGGAVTEVIPASAMALAGMDNSPGTSHGDASNTPADRPDNERLISLG